MLELIVLCVVVAFICHLMGGQPSPKPRGVRETTPDVTPWGFRNASGDFIYTKLQSYEDATARAYLALKQDIDGLEKKIDDTEDKIEIIKASREYFLGFSSSHDEVDELKDDIEYMRETFAWKRLVRRKIKRMIDAKKTVRPSEDLVPMIGNRSAWYNRMDELAKEWYETRKDKNLDWDAILLCQIEVCRTWRHLDD